ncbi:hypothetical protein PV325_008216 [Microctonus aethiopoides]|uniref:Trafficking protein particle complex subunit 6B n=1 Tax=Microctonus aethiopoides TaxID=144406 RepID=A0AA39C924_9HYME|nr:hypothetical protein PV325_008216 [Microctonus aethiopoides]KAK0093299.1 hypothetical protein PV326_013872 [Microctonus aethiopoides]KAK0159957.1 hypothetical protein PV328_007412 [Microctonus aethiopoides]
MKPQMVEQKLISSTSGEADECLFDYLHAELVNYVLTKNIDSKEGEENLTQLEWMGFGVGYRVIERLTREWARFKDELDMIKFICTDFWSSLYQKQIDNLKTNHHGTYVLQDNEFRLLKNLGIKDSQQYLSDSPKLLAFTCGLLRGSLANLGIVSIVKAEVSALPSCKFHVEVKPV